LRELLQVLSHEIMNALTPVASLAATAGELLQDQTPASTALAREAVATLGRRAEGLTRFVEAYRTLARLPPPRLAPTAVSALIDETARLFRSRWSTLGVALETRWTPGDDLVVKLDSDLMIHALMNILSNAAEASLAASTAPPSVGLFAGIGAAGGIELLITDSGNGVADEDRDRIFQPFFTTKAPGRGATFVLTL
jgi:signal transduction histidine kinase